MAKEYLYTSEWRWDKPYGTMEIDGFEVPVVLPKMPDKKKIINYGKKIKDQKFRKEVIPDDLERWPEKEMDKFVEKMYHKRQHGEWWYIKGQPYYITGKFWHYLNFWWVEAGMYPEFREGDMLFYLVWEHCWRDPNCCGEVDIKGRRMGDTEKALHLMYELASGTKYTWCGMQNVTDTDAGVNFKRIVAAHSEMAFFFRPILPSSSDPGEVLEFKYPRKIFSLKQLEKKKKKGTGQGELTYKYDPIKSKIDFKASVLGAYDGDRLGLWHLDEPGKIKAFDVNAQWRRVKPALALKNGKDIIGKALWTTTVEDFESAETMKHIKKTFDESNPKQRNKNNRTKSGLYRYFRNCVYAYGVDEWGFHLKEECIEFVKNERESYESDTDWDGLADFNRKHPITIEDVFRPPHSECVLFPVYLDKRISQIDNGLAGNDQPLTATGSEVKPLEIKGDFAWVDGFGSKVKWMPNAKGKWRVSHHPEKPNNCFVRENGIHPGNDALYTMGVDPVDHMAEDGGGSDGGAAIYRRFNEMVDCNLDRNEEGEVQEWDVWKMQTDRFIADYLDRPDNPYEIFEQMLMGAIYYGVAIFPEKDRGSIIPWFEDKDFKHYIKRRPRQTVVETAGNKNKKFKKEKGIKASKGVIHLYTQELKKHVYFRWQTYHHTRILNDFREYNVKNRTKRDLTVACGMALLAAMDHKELGKKKKEDDWSKGLPVKKRVHRI